MVAPGVGQDCEAGPNGLMKTMPEWQGIGSKPHHCIPQPNTRAAPAIQAKTAQILL